MLQGTFSGNKQWRDQILSTDGSEKSSWVALRECSGNGWGRPQLGGCISNWIKEKSSNYKNGISDNWLTNDLKYRFSQLFLYGGDFSTLLEIREKLKISKVEFFQSQSGSKCD